MPPTRRSPASSGDPNWHKKRYPRNPDPPDVRLPRPLFPPDSVELGKTPSPHGPDVIAYKRALSRAQRWLPWNPPGWDDSYSNAFSHGKSAGDIDVSGVAGFQSQAGIEASGCLDEATFEVLRTSLVPKKPRVEHAGEPLFDLVCISLLQQSAEQFAARSPDEDDIRGAIAEFCMKAEANEPRWHYSQNRPVRLGVNPSASSVTSDCSGIIIQAYDFAKRKTGLDVPDPAKQRWSGYGNTDLFEDDHPRVTDGDYQVGDLAHYHGHVTICRKAGDATTALWTSHGQESGPESHSLHYRSDFRFVVRPPVLS